MQTTVLFALLAGCAQPLSPPSGTLVGSGTTVFTETVAGGAVYTCDFDFELRVDPDSDPQIEAHTLADCFNHVIEAPIMPKCWRGSLIDDTTAAGTIAFDDGASEVTELDWTGAWTNWLVATVTGTATGFDEWEPHDYDVTGHFVASPSDATYDSAECQHYAWP